MMIHLYKKRLILNYHNSVIALAVMFILAKTQLFATNTILANLVDILQWPFLVYITSTLIKSKIKKNLIKKTIVGCVVLLVFFFSYRNSGLANLFKFAVIIFAAKNLCDYSIFGSLRNRYFVITILTMVLGALKIIPSITVRRGYFSYGFIHSNVLAMFVLSTVCCDIIVNKSKVTFKRYFLYVIVMAITVIMTDCRSVAVGFVTILITIMIFAFLKEALCKNKFIRFLICFIPEILMLISLYIAYNYNISNTIMLELNALSSNRLYMAHRLTEAFSLTLLGQDCGSLLMENAYITVLFAWGIIPGLITIIYYSFSIHKALTRNHYNVVACLLGFAVQGVFEGSTLELFLNFALLTTFINFSNNLLPEDRLQYILLADNGGRISA